MDIDTKLKIAADLTLQAEHLFEMANEMLEPVVLAAIQSGDVENMVGLYHKIPRGFYRTELLTHLITIGIRP